MDKPRVFFSLLICLWLSTASVAASSDLIPVVAVFLMESRGSKLSGDTINGLTDYLATRLGENGRLQIIPRDEIYKRLKVQKQKSLKECYDANCQIEIGRELAAQYSVSSTISRVGKKICLITANVFDLRKAATTRSAAHRGGCEDEDLVDGVEQIAYKLEYAMTGNGRHPEAKQAAKTKAVQAPPPEKPEPTEKPKKKEVAVAATQKGTLKVLDQVVIDERFGLMWERGTSEQPIVWEEAEKRCQNIKLGGYRDWSVPDIHQLRSLISGCAKEGQCGNLKSDIGCEYCEEGEGEGENGWYMRKGVWNNPEYPWFWSSTELEGYPDYHYSVWYLGGYVSYYTNREPYHVRCVRSLR